MFYTWKIGKTFYTYFSPLTLDNFLVSFLPLSCSQFLSPITQVSALSHNPVSHSPIAHHSPSLGSSLLLHLSAFFAHKATTLSSTSPIPHPAQPILHQCPPTPTPPTNTNHHHRHYQPSSHLFLAQTHLPISLAPSLGFNWWAAAVLGFWWLPNLTSAGLLYFEIRFFVCGVFFFWVFQSGFAEVFFWVSDLDFWLLVVFFWGGLVVGGNFGGCFWMAGVVLVAVFPSDVEFWVVVVCITVLAFGGFENYENIFILQWNKHWKMISLYFQVDNQAR